MDRTASSLEGLAISIETRLINTMPPVGMMTDDEMEGKGLGCRCLSVRLASSSFTFSVVDGQ